MQPRAFKKSDSINHYIKNKQSKIKPTIKQSVKQLCTNFWYKIGGESILSKKVSEGNFNQIYLLGKKYYDLEQLKNQFQQLFWFTYRKQISINSQTNTDLGWGCLIRVGQMLLANSLRRYFMNKQNQVDQLNILTAFLDDDQGTKAKYSFQRILCKGQKKFKLKAGQWYNISQICYVLMSLQNITPMKGSQDLKMIYFNQTLIFLDQVYQKIGIQPCRCLNRKICCQICHGQVNYKKNNINKNSKKIYSILQELDFEQLHIEDEEQFQQLQPIQNNENLQQQQQPNQQPQVTFDILVIVSTRISHKHVSKQHYSSILSILNLPSSMGIIGGVPNKGMYFTGSLDDNLIYLDPHLVQNSVKKTNLSKDINTFHCTEIRTIGREKLDSSLAFAFYLRKLKDLAELIEKIQQLKIDRPDSVPISYMWENQFRDSSEVLLSNQYEIDECSPDFSFIT